MTIKIYIGADHPAQNSVARKNCRFASQIRLCGTSCGYYEK